MTESDFSKKIPKYQILGQIGSKMAFFEVFQSFLRIGSSDFSGFLSKVSGQYRLITGGNRLFGKNLNFDFSAIFGHSKMLKMAKNG